MHQKLIAFGQTWPLKIGRCTCICTMFMCLYASLILLCIMLTCVGYFKMLTCPSDVLCFYGEINPVYVANCTLLHLILRYTISPCTGSHRKTSGIL